ncbi:MFS transporter [Bradyrhizobium japonicum]|uniref:MFS transporter n=1 Tax=Bradyrhizobium japonicum TaxID=375 RepID=UPI0004AE8AAF|nr:MFS transporter [Bradyrhizobium japonicum]
MSIALERQVGSQTARSKEVIAGSIGNVLDCYDFSVYAFFVPTISSAFFPAKTELSSLLFAFGAFGAGFVARPLGAMLFGIYGDRVGRRASLATVSILMGLATVAIGLMPTADTIGLWAAVGIVAARLLQGFAAGGEYGSAIPFLVEMSGPGQRGFVGSWHQCGNAIGLLIGSMAALALTNWLPPEEMSAWGWRLPFVAGILPAAFGWYIRSNVAETPVFTRLEKDSVKEGSPLRAVFSSHKADLLKAMGMIVGIAAGFYIILVFMPTYLGLVSKIDRSAALLVTTVGLIVYALVCPIAGILSDRYGRKKVLLVANLGTAILTYPLLAILGTGDLTTAILGESVLAAFLALCGGPISAAVAETASAKVRATIVSVSFAVSITIFGGFAPFIGTFLISTFATPLAPAFYGVATALVSCGALFAVRETAFDNTI